MVDATPRRDLAAIINSRTSLVSSGLLWRGVVPLAVARAWAHSPRTQENACYHKKERKYVKLGKRIDNGPKVDNGPV